MNFVTFGGNESSLTLFTGSSLIHSFDVKQIVLIWLQENLLLTAFDTWDGPVSVSVYHKHTQTNTHMTVLFILLALRLLKKETPTGAPLPLLHIGGSTLRCNSVQDSVLLSSTVAWLNPTRWCSARYQSLVLMELQKENRTGILPFGFEHFEPFWTSGVLTSKYNV